MQSLIITTITYIIFFLLYKSNKGDDLKKLFIIYAAVFGVLGFLLQPNEAYDLFMHYTYLNKTRSFGLIFLQSGGKAKGLFTYQYLFYLFSKFPIDNFLGMFTGFITYFLPLMVIYNYSKDHDLKKQETMIIAALFLSCQNFIAIVSNVRLPLAFAVFVYLLYYEQKNPKLRIPALIIYFVLVFLHPSILLPIGMRYIFVIKTVVLRRFFLLVFLSWFSIVPYFLQYTSSSEGLIKYINTMMYEYTQDFEKNTHNIVANLSYSLMMVSISGVVLFVLYSRYYMVRKKRSSFFEYIYLGMACAMFGSIATSYHFFIRFGYLIIMMNVYPVVTILKSQLKNKSLCVQLLKALSFFALVSNYVLQYRTAEFGWYLYK